MSESFVEHIIDKSQDLPRWYTDVVLKAKLADYAPIHGCMVVRPYGYAIWENMQALLDKRIKATGHENAYFPLLIPESLLKKEAEHIQGFSPQVAWVTEGGDEKLTERLAIRPTSETIICTMYSKWVQSWRDLPILINQWCNVLRWEKETRFFLRTMEFLWQEGHTVHCTEDEAENETIKMLEVYREFIETDLAIPVISGRKSERERFAGGLRTYTIEAMMPDGKSLQAGTSHNLGQNFTKSFNITFLDRDGQQKFAWTTSWGVSTRLIGGLIMIHGDDAGLILPPHVAPIQVVIIPIGFSEMKNDSVSRLVERVESELKMNYRVKVDWQPQVTTGWKFNEWELRGVPIRIEIGPAEARLSEVLIVRRDTREKVSLPVKDVSEQIGVTLEQVQKNLFNRAKIFLDSHIYSVSDYEEFQDTINKRPGFIKAFWCGKPECEDEIKNNTGATIRCIPIDVHTTKGKCVFCGEVADSSVFFARAY